jgi:hypothetical protein
MIKYEEFERATKDIADDYDNWLHLLPAIPLAHRPRFIGVIKRGIDIPTAFDYIMCSQRLNEDKFNEFLDNAIEKSKAGFPG